MNKYRISMIFGIGLYLSTPRAQTVIFDRFSVDSDGVVRLIPSVAGQQPTDAIPPSTNSSAGGGLYEVSPDGVIRPRTGATIPSATPFRLTAIPTNVVVGESIFVQWEAPPFPAFTALDWVGLFAKEADNRTFLERKFISFRGGDTSFTAVAPGTFDFRYIRWNGDKVATSETITVSGVVANPHWFKNYPSKRDQIVAFGDSIVAGVGSKPGNDFVSRLSVAIRYPIINAGRSGDTVAMARERLATDVLRHPPQIVIVMLGGNDFLQNVPRTQTLADIRSIVSAIQESGAVVILVGTHDDIAGAHFAYQLRRIADEMKAAYVPNVLRGILGNPSLMSDAVHPNDAGYAIIAERILPTLRSIFLNPGALRVKSNAYGIELSWFGTTNRTYRVLSASGITVANWETTAIAIGDNSRIRIVVPTDETQRFYRLLPIE